MRLGGVGPLTSWDLSSVTHKMKIVVIPISCDRWKGQFLSTMQMLGVCIIIKEVYRIDLGGGEHLERISL